MDQTSSLDHDDDSRMTSLDSRSDSHVDQINDGDSDDLQFVDDLNDDIESTDQPITPAADRSGSSSNNSSSTVPSLEPASLAPPAPSNSSVNEVDPSDQTKDGTSSSQPSNQVKQSDQTEMGSVLQKPTNVETMKQTNDESDIPTSQNQDLKSRVVSAVELPAGNNESGQSASTSQPTPSVKEIFKHFIDGLIIEESSKPFPVHRSSLLTELFHQTKKKVSRRRTTGGATSQSSAQRGNRATPIVPSRQVSNKAHSQATPANISSNVYNTTPNIATNTSMIEGHATGDTGYESCTMCAAACVNLCFYRGDPYCSRQCTKKRKKGLYADPDAPPPKRGRPVGAMTRNKPTQRNSGKLAKVIFRRHKPKSSDSSNRPQSGSLSSTPDHLIGRLPSENSYESEDSAMMGFETHSGGRYSRADIQCWTISEVCTFIRTLPGCERFARIFEEEEIDGRALAHLSYNHLLYAMNIHSIPALTIHSEINALSS